MSAWPEALPEPALAVRSPMRSPWARMVKPQKARQRQPPPHRAVHPSHPHRARHPQHPAKLRPALRQQLPPATATTARHPYRRKARHRAEAVRPLPRHRRKGPRPWPHPGLVRRPSPSPVRKPGPCRQGHALRRRSAPLRRKRFHCRVQARHPLAAGRPFRPCPCRTKRLFDEAEGHGRSRVFISYRFRPRQPPEASCSDVCRCGR